MKSCFFVSNIFGDHMVLQRNKPIRITGCATPCFSVTATLAGDSATASADKEGSWALELPARREGGPYILRISDECGASVDYRDVMIGDVWFCSGQSNMEFPVRGNRFYSLPEGDKLAEAAKDGGLRLMQVRRGLNPDGPCELVSSGCQWKVATSPDAVGEFSAVGFIFGQELRGMLGENVPIGMINGSWGGSMIEPWIPESEYRLRGSRTDIEYIEGCKIGNFSAERSEAREQARRKEAGDAIRAWLKKYFETDPETTRKALAEWHKPGLDTSDWRKGEKAKLNALSRVCTAWYRIEFDIPERFVGKKLMLHIGFVNDIDETYVDGVKVGENSVDNPSYWAISRDYVFRAGEPAAGARHVVAIRAMNHFSIGGISDDIAILDPATGDVVADLAKLEWAEKVEFVPDPNWVGRRPAPLFDTNSTRNNMQARTALYNAMVHPFTAMNIRGVIWYQGCSNAGDPQGYIELQSMLIDSWRKAWRDPAMPFLITQLAAFHIHRPENREADDYWAWQEPDDEPGYAPMREAQERFLDYPGAGVACTIDVGDHSDIHPADKFSVARRLAREAARVSYGDASALPGPRFASKKVDGKFVRVKLANTGDGIYLRGGKFGPHMLAVAGDDKRFVWAEGMLDGDTLVAWSDKVPAPRYVRYAYSAFPPQPTVFRKGDDLPLFPFNA